MSICYPAVPSAPKSVQVDTIAGQPHQLQVTWQPPDVPNGLVIEYRVLCFESRQVNVSSDGSGNDIDDGAPRNIENSVSNSTVLGSEVSAMMGGLDPYTRYDCAATAYTSAGEGEASTLASGVTDQSRKQNICPSQYNTKQ